MKNLNSLQKYGSLESFAIDQTEQFLRPRTFLDMVFLLTLIFWMVSAVFFQGDNLFRASMFFFGIILFFLIPLYMVISPDSKTADSPLNRAIKILIFFVFIYFFTANKPPIFELWDSSTLLLTYAEIERTIVCLLVPLAILWKSFSLETLKFGYIFYIGRILQGYWVATLILFIFRGINLFRPITGFVIDIDILLLIAYGVYLIGNILPGAPLQVSLNASNIFDQYNALKSRTERVRDALLSASFVLMIFLFLPGWFSLEYRDFFQYIAFIGLIMGIILIFAPHRHTSAKFGSLVGSLSGQALDPSSQLGNRVQNFARTIRETDFQKPQKVYTIPTDGMKIVSKGKTTLTAKKGAIAVPTVTEKGTALVLMGKSEMKTETEDQQTTTKEIDGTTTVWVPREEWEDIKVQLNPKEMNELTEKELTTAGLESITTIFDTAQSAINDLKTWRGPRGIFSSVLDEAPSKYSITETKDYSLVNIPGVYVFESSEIQLVNVLGGLVKVIEIKGVGEYVQVLGGFVTVMETPDYSFVQTPFVSVLETPKGEVVKVFGIKIQEGEEINIAQARERILEDQRSFNNLFTKRVESLFREDPQVLLAESKGEKLGFIVSEDEILSDTRIPTKSHRKKDIHINGIKGIKGVKGIKGIKAIQRGSKHHGHVRTKPKTRVKNQVTTTPRPLNFNQKDPTDIIQLDLNKNEFSATHLELLKIEEDLKRIEESINRIDEKLINDEISENKHTEMINRLKTRQKQLIKKRESHIEKEKIRFV
ncbi:MAG: hypothetical protein ACFFAJ_01530 [Candidatus Hodarchaeota archaeon]